MASCSYAARQYGIHSAMSMAQALRRCPPLRIVPPRFAAYRAASAEVMARLTALTPLVEQLSIDEAFLDVTTLSASGEYLARQLQQTIQRDLGELSQAKALYERVLAVAPQDAHAQSGLAGVLHDLGDAEGAQKRFRHGRQSQRTSH